MKKTILLTSLFAVGAFAAPALAQVYTDGSAGAESSFATSGGAADTGLGTTTTDGADSSLPGLPNTGGGWGQ